MLVFPNTKLTILKILFNSSIYLVEISNQKKRNYSKKHFQQSRNLKNPI